MPGPAVSPSFILLFVASQASGWYRRRRRRGAVTGLKRSNCTRSSCPTASSFRLHADFPNIFQRRLLTSEDRRVELWSMLTKHPDVQRHPLLQKLIRTGEDAFAHPARVHGDAGPITSHDSLYIFLWGPMRL